METSVDFDIFRAKLLSHDHGCELTATFGPRPVPPVEPSVEADRFVSSLGFQPIGDSWRQLDRGAFRAALANSLCNGLVHNSRFIAPSTASALAETFIAFFDEDRKVRFLVNFQAGGRRWMPISTSTFEAAFLALDASSIGLLLIEEED